MGHCQAREENLSASVGYGALVPTIPTQCQYHPPSVNRMHGGYCLETMDRAGPSTSETMAS